MTVSKYGGRELADQGRGLRVAPRAAYRMSLDDQRNARARPGLPRLRPGAGADPLRAQRAAGYNSSLFSPLSAEMSAVWIASHLAGLHQSRRWKSGTGWSRRSSPGWRSGPTGRMSRNPMPVYGSGLAVGCTELVALIDCCVSGP